MWMPSNKLMNQAIGNRIEIKGSQFLTKLTQKNNLKQYVTKLFFNLPEVFQLDRFCQLVTFLEGIRNDASKRLLLIPRTTAIGISQSLHYAL